MYCELYSCNETESLIEIFFIQNVIWLFNLHIYEQN